MPQPKLSSFRQRTIQLQERVFAFARQVLSCCPRQLTDEPSRVVWRQLVRAAASASGNLEEADEASSTMDFIFKMKLATREMKEARRWLRLVVACRLAHHDRVGPLEDESRQLAAILATIVVNTKRRVSEEKARPRQ